MIRWLMNLETLRQPSSAPPSTSMVKTTSLIFRETIKEKENTKGIHIPRTLSLLYETHSQNILSLSVWFLHQTCNMPDDSWVVWRHCSKVGEALKATWRTHNRLIRKETPVSMLTVNRNILKTREWCQDGWQSCTVWQSGALALTPGTDKSCPLSYEPSGTDFLSPCIQVA